MELSATAKVILGMLSRGPRTGYEIKAFVDKSTRFFWAASYGQIYPELRALEAAGLVAGQDAPSGGRRRTVYRLTDEGDAALRAWLSRPPEVAEMRHEGMLKVFFSDILPAEQQVRRLLDMRDQHVAKLEALRAVEPMAAEHPDNSTYLVLRFGIDFNQWIAEWCERAADDLLSDTKPSQRST
jgi:PadR family transcriptional regulator AphA